MQDSGLEHVGKTGGTSLQKINDQEIFKDIKGSKLYIKGNFQIISCNDSFMKPIFTLKQTKKRQFKTDMKAQLY